MRYISLILCAIFLSMHTLPIYAVNSEKNNLSKKEVKAQKKVKKLEKKLEKWSASGDRLLKKPMAWLALGLAVAAGLSGI